jgi:predicted transcriptional regulator
MSAIYYRGEISHRINLERGNKILEVMLDQVNRKIILCIKDEPKTALQVSVETGLSSSMTYRRLQGLKKKNLLIISGEIATNKKKRFKHKSKIRKVVISFDGNVMDIKIYSNMEN